MIDEIKKVLTEILTIIDYNEDKNQFIFQFIQLCQANAFSQLLAQLPQGQQDRLKEEMEHATSKDAAQTTIAKYLHEEAFLTVLLDEIQKQFQDYLATIYPTLSQEQSKKLDAFLTTLPKPAMPQ